MKCERCGKKEAEFNYFEVQRDGVRVEKHLCRDCAIEIGLLQNASDDRTIESQSLVIPDCPVCGLTFEEFQKDRIFGCAECYNTFRPALYRLFREIQGSDKYSGKFLAQDERILAIKKNLRLLKKKLEQFVEEERYEEAIKIRDEIARYEEQLKEYGKA